MLDTATPSLASLPPMEADPLLALITMCNADPRPDKIDVGVGVYRDAAGGTPILRAVKAAEQHPVGGAGDQGLSRHRAATPASPS